MENDSSFATHLANGNPEIKSFERLIFPTKYVIQKIESLAIGQVRSYIV